ncbi:unnamed protein product [Vitrella brassicaformis CCMP3155]|uniref:Uncharacterized protein n=1 Tax=Vitrella brassicaformis (strain CCMP3155) TaxID=1169540 RepID=A0A0G4EFK9_VITBC|nr:unnamed protein product [Vitrella brassicaformis CCMP3155]|eukprot:CEL94214.1 unnamed protein product [Vitrella brassicaformis CCMP3155]
MHYATECLWYSSVMACIGLPLFSRHAAHIGCDVVRIGPCVSCCWFGLGYRQCGAPPNTCGWFGFLTSGVWDTDRASTHAFTVTRV